MADPFHIKYRTQTIRPRQGPLGALARAVSAHPVRAGLIGGSSAVAIAFFWSFKGATTDPILTLILGAIVVAAWTFLFWLMRGFFAQQTTMRVDVIRTLGLDEDTLTWTEQGEHVRTVHVKDMTLWRKHEDSSAGVTPALWVAKGEHEQFVLETRLTQDEGQHLPVAAMELVEAIDEQLPTHVVSPLLQRART